MYSRPYSARRVPRASADFLLTQFVFFRQLSFTAMLPSRLFRNTGIPPPLRSLLVPHASLPANVKVMFRLRLGGSRLQMASPFLNSRHYSTPITSSTETVTSQKLPEAMEPRLSMTFTCTVKDCGTRSSHEFSKRAYTKGIVIVQCPGCENRCVVLHKEMRSLL